MKRTLLLVLSILFFAACTPQIPAGDATATQDALNNAGTQTAAAVITATPLVPVTPTPTVPPLPVPPDIATQTTSELPSGVNAGRPQAKLDSTVSWRGEGLSIVVTEMFSFG